MPIKNLTLGAVLLLSGTALAQNHHNTHIVRKGESLDKIAKWTGVSKHQLIVANNLSTKKFKPGLTLIIPAHASSGPKHYNLSAAGYAPYTIKKHDSAARIANLFHMTPAAVKSINPQTSWSHPQVGSRIRIPLRNAFILQLARVPVIKSRYAKVVKPETVVRRAPGGNAGRVTRVDAGREVRILARDDHWYKVRFESGTEGWVRGDLLTPEIPKVVAHHETRHYKVVHQSSRVASHRAPHIRGLRNQPSVSASNLPSTGSDMLGFAQSMQGTPYSYGSASRHATDCSGFVKQVLQHEGVKLPRTAAEQSRKGQHVSGGDMKPGDLVFFHPSRGSRISHVGIYMGNGKFIHASSGGGKVQVNSLDDKYYKKNFATARRVAKVKTHKSHAEKLAEAHAADEAAMKRAEREMKPPTNPTDTVDN